MSNSSTVQQNEQKFNEAVATNEKKINEAYDKVSSTAQDELAKVKAEFDDFKKRSGPKVQEAENFLTSPSAIGFYQGKVNILKGYKRVMFLIYI
jgi:molecular chaperone GrpE (heat shock protein)